LLENLQDEYRITIDRNLELISIRHFTEEVINEIKRGKAVLMEERAKNTVQLVVKDAPLMRRKDS
jgi:aspartate kinase